jgi:hypothetical protein
VSVYIYLLMLPARPAILVARRRFYYPTPPSAAPFSPVPSVVASQANIPVPLHCRTSECHHLCLFIPQFQAVYISFWCIFSPTNRSPRFCPYFPLFSPISHLSPRWLMAPIHPLLRLFWFLRSHLIPPFIWCVYIQSVLEGHPVGTPLSRTAPADPPPIMRRHRCPRWVCSSAGRVCGGLNSISRIFLQLTAGYLLSLWPLDSI